MSGFLLKGLVVDQLQLIMPNYTEQFCAIYEFLSLQGLPNFLVDKLESFRQLISNEVSDSDMFPRFWIRRTLTFGTFSVFSPILAVFH